MKVLVFFLVVSFLIGGTGYGRIIRERPLLLMAFAFVIAASYWSLGVVLG